MKGGEGEGEGEGGEGRGGGRGGGKEGTKEVLIMAQVCDICNKGKLSGTQC